MATPVPPEFIRLYLEVYEKTKDDLADPADPIQALLDQIEDRYWEQIYNFLQTDPEELAKHPERVGRRERLQELYSEILKTPTSK